MRKTYFSVRVFVKDCKRLKETDEQIIGHMGWALKCHGLVFNSDESYGDGITYFMGSEDWNQTTKPKPMSAKELAKIYKGGK